VVKVSKGLTRLQAIVILVVIVLAGLAGYLALLNLSGGGGEGPQPKEEVTLKIITRHSSTIWSLTKKHFLTSDIAKEYNIVDLKFLGPNPVLWEKTITGSGDIDIAWGGGPTLFDELAEADLLAPITDDETLGVVGEIADEFGGAPLKRYDSDNNLIWVASAISSFGFIVNEPVLNDWGLPYPKLWEDLASPEFGQLLPKPVLAYSRPTQSTSHTRIYEIILQKFGWDKGWAILAMMAANGRPYSGSVEALSAVESGEVAVSVGIDFYGYSAEVQFPGNKYVLPFNESIVNGDPIALLKTSKHVEAALAFIRWVLSIEGQKIWLDKKVNRMPVREDVFNTPEGQQRPDLYKNYQATKNNIGIPFNDSLALSYEYSMRYYFDAVFADVHDDLVKAWSLLVGKYLNGELSKDEFDHWAFELGKPLTWTEDGKEVSFTLKFAQQLNDKFRLGQEVSKYQKLWREAAVARYSWIVQQLGG
jgi:ABC-type Fe3+ transport system substrate-binding protein